MCHDRISDIHLFSFDPHAVRVYLRPTALHPSCAQVWLEAGSPLATPPVARRRLRAHRQLIPTLSQTIQCIRTRFFSSPNFQRTLNSATESQNAL